MPEMLRFVKSPPSNGALRLLTGTDHLLVGTKACSVSTAKLEEIHWQCCSMLKQGTSTQVLVVSQLSEHWHAKASLSPPWPGRKVVFHGEKLRKLPNLKQMNKQVSP